LDVPNPRDEVGQLATTINALLARLDAAFQEQKRFIADASMNCGRRLPYCAARLKLPYNKIGQPPNTRIPGAD